MEIAIILTLATFVALACFFAEGEEVKIGTAPKIVKLSQAKPELKDYELLQARDRLCAKNGIRGFDVLKFEAVQLKTDAGWVTTLQRIKK